MQVMLMCKFPFDLIFFPPPLPKEMTTKYYKTYLPLYLTKVHWPLYRHASLHVCIT